MLMMFVDALALMVLMRVIGGEELEFTSALLLAVGASVGTNILVSVCFAIVGPVGIFAGVGIAAAGVGVVMSAMYGVEIKRAITTGVAFVMTHIAAVLLLQSALQA